MRNNTATLRLSIWCLTLGLALLLAVPNPAHAGEDTKLSARQKRQVRTLVKRAKTHKKAADRLAKRKGAKNQKKAKASYHKAATAYRKAFATAALAPLLVELAQVYQARGELPWALRTYKKYLELDPEGALVETAKSGIVDVEAAIEEAELKGEELPAGDPAIDPTDIIGPEPEPVVEEPVEEPVAEEPEKAEEPDKTEETPKTLQISAPPRAPGRVFFWSGIGTAVVGAALVGTGIGFGVSAKNAGDTLSGNDDGWNFEDRELIDSGRSAQTKMYIFTAIGGAALAGGAALIYMGMSADKEPERDTGKRAILAPSITPDGATLTVMGRF